MDAQYNLGVLYYKGMGVTQSYSEAVMWYSKAAENGHPVAQYDLGVCYYNGKGVPQSRDEAVRWWRVAAQQGNENAKKALRDI